VSIESQLTHGPGRRILTNANVWSPDGKWIVYDTRSDAAGSRFDGTRIEVVNVDTRQVRVLYESRNGACCGVATWHPIKPEVAFILGPEHPTLDWSYGASRRQGAIVSLDNPGIATNLDARDLTPPFTPGALRGGSHVHIWSPCGQRVSFTYEDQIAVENATAFAGLRDVGVCVCLPGLPVIVPKSHKRNHDGTAFGVLVTNSVLNPTPGSDAYSRACEEAWLGTQGYRREDGSWQRWALAFLGTVRTTSGETISEVFVSDLPDDLTRQGDGPLQGTSTLPPSPPFGVKTRRLTFTEQQRFPGSRVPRHWLRSSPDGSRIGFLMGDDAGIVQFWTVSPNGGPPVQVTRNPRPIASCFTWHPSGDRVAFVMDHSVCEVSVETGETRRVTDRSEEAPRPEACVYSPDGGQIAFVRLNQIYMSPLM